MGLFSMIKRLFVSTVDDMVDKLENEEKMLKVDCQQQILGERDIPVPASRIGREQSLTERYMELLIKALREDDWESSFIMVAGDTFGSYRNPKRGDVHFRIQCGIGLIDHACVYVGKKEVMSFAYSWPFTILHREVGNMKRRMNNKRVTEKNEVARKALESCSVGGDVN